MLASTESLIIIVSKHYNMHTLRTKCFIVFAQSLQEDGFNQVVYILSCSKKLSDIWIAIIYAYIGLLQLAAIFMAFTTRKVNIKALNDTKETAVMIYLNSIIITALIVAEFGLDTHLNTCVALFGCALFVAATLFLAVVFIPRVNIPLLEAHEKKA